MTRNEYLRKYYEYGWTIVPVLKGTKRPSVNWKDYQTRKPTKDELRTWFNDPDVGIGLITGKASGVIVIDEDSYKEQGKQLSLNSPLIVKTGGGGKHYYFKYQEGITNTVNRENAIDTRGEGGFVVLPPTLHPSGNHYEWLTDLPANLDNLPSLDESYAQEMIRPKSSSVNFNGEPIRLSDFMNISEGSRNDSLHRIACSVLNKVPDELSESDAVRLIESANSSYSPPLPYREVETIIRSAMAFVRANPKQTYKPIRLNTAEPAGKSAQEVEQGMEQQMAIMSYDVAREKYEEMRKKYGDGLTSGYDTIDYYFKFVPKNLYMISASTHVGKTTLVLNIAGRIARAGHKVIVASLEQGVFVIPRLESMFGGSEGLTNISFVAPDDLPTPQDFLNLFKDVDSRPRLLIIDHLHYFRRGNRGATEEMDKLVVDMQRLANKLDVPVLVVAHVRKLNQLRDKRSGKERAPTMDDLKDSSSLSQIPAVVAMLHREKNSEEDIEHGESIFSNNGTLYIYKNRIYGRTGAEKFTIYDNGEIIFDRHPEDKIRKIAENMENKDDIVVGLEGYFDELSK